MYSAYKLNKQGDNIQPWQTPFLIWNQSFPWSSTVVKDHTAACVCVCVCAQSSPTLCDPMDYSSPGSIVHGIFQARILEQIAISFPRGSSRPKDQTHISCISCTDRWILYHCATCTYLHDIKHQVRRSLSGYFSFLSALLAYNNWLISL